MNVAEIDYSAEPASIILPKRYNAAVEFVDVHIPAGRGDKAAFIDDQASYSYAELTERVNRAGNALLSLGLPSESRVLLCLQDTIDFPTAFFGAMKAGLVPVPLNTLMTTDDYAYILSDSRARALIVSDDLYEKWDPIISGSPHLNQVVISHGHRHGKAILSDLLDAASHDLAPAATSPDDVAFWLYTSGSTGRPKGAMHMHRDLIYTAVHYGRGVLGIREDDLAFSAAKMFFAYGLGNTLTFPLFAGATAVVHAGRPTPDSVLSVLQHHKPTIFFGVPTLYAAMVAAEIAPGDGAERLRLAVSAGEALPQDVGNRWQSAFDTEIIDGLGSTEMLHIFLSNRPGHARYGTTGKAIPGYDLRLLDEAGNDVGTGEIGELTVRGGSAAMAYWNQREKSLRTFQGPWTRTGDQYTVDADGYYTYAGRNDDMLKVSGIWVSPFEVESALIEHDAVLEVGVVGAPDADQLIKPKAFVVTAAGTPGDDKLTMALQDYVKSRLAPHKYPRWIEYVEELPKTATGKVQRYKLRSRDS